jgi:dTDP-3-amino-3,4,6-trideoxy-alpha-D-glucose transaminase
VTASRRGAGSPAGVLIPTADPRAAYLAHRREIDGAIAGVLAAGSYILGEQVAAFERELAAYLGVRHAVAVASGTDALHIALRALGIGLGDEVIVVAHTAAATVNGVWLAGAQPVFVDVDPATLTMDPAAAAAAVTPRSRAILPVHLYGHPADLPALRALADERGLALLEDCAQSAGASCAGRRTGAWGTLGAFSFYPTKNLAALGDGGAVATDDAALAGRVRMLRQYGWRTRGVSEVPGFNSRLDELQAAILRVKLRHLDGDNRRRRQIAALYSAALAGSPLALPPLAVSCSPVYHQYVVRHPERDALARHLLARGIATLVHYPVPVHLQPAFRHSGRRGGPLTHSERAAATVLSLPMFPQLPDSAVQAVAAAIIDWPGLGSVG